MHSRRVVAVLVVAAIGTLVAPQALGWSSWDVGDVRRVSTAPDGRDFVNMSLDSVMSADSRFVVFWSGAPLLPGLIADGNLFRRNLVTGQLRLVSADSAGNPADHDSSSADISADGRYVVFQSMASNLDPAVERSRPQIYLKDMVTDSVRLISRSPDGEPANAAAFHPTISPSAATIAFDSEASNLTASDDNGWSDVFAVDRPTGDIRLASTDTSGGPANNGSWQPLVADDGRLVFQSLASDLAAPDEDTCTDVFVVNADGSRRMLNLRCPPTTDVTYAFSGNGSVAAYGRTVVNLTTGERWTPNAMGVVESLSGGGRFASFQTSAPLVAKDDNNAADLYLRDLANDRWRLVTVSSSGDLSTRGYPHDSSLSGDASYLSFTSWDTDLVRNDDNDRRDVFVARLR